MNETIVDQLYHEFQALILYLDEQNEISFRNTANDNFIKTLLLTAASYFESYLTDELIKFVEEISKENELLIQWVKNKAISRQYHTFNILL